MQEDRDWTSGSKTGKLRGLNAKNRADLELFLNCSGSRVNSRKVQGLFNKKGRLKWYLRMRAVGSGSGGSGLIRSRSNLVRWLRIGRPGPNWRGTRRRCVAGTQVPRWRSAQARRSSPFSALRGSIQPVLGSGVISVDRVIHLSTLGEESVLGRGWPWCGAALGPWRAAFTWYRPGYGSGFGTWSIYTAWLNHTKS